jgi:hypothetical protein
MITGAHSIIYSKNGEADRAFLRDVLRLPHVDVGGGWLIFGLPPAEVAVHPSDENDVHELYLMCDDVEEFAAAMRARGVACSDVRDQGYGLFTQVTLPGGGKLGVYQPRHARPKSVPVRGGAPKSGGEKVRRAAGERGTVSTRRASARRGGNKAGGKKAGANKAGAKKAGAKSAGAKSAGAKQARAKQAGSKARRGAPRRK